MTIKILVAGDWHANTTWIPKQLDLAADMGIDTIYHLGDFGFRFTRGWVDWLTKDCRKHGVKIKFIDGNHDNHPYLFGLRPWPGGEKSLTDSVAYLPRNHRFKIENVQFHALGGAVSVDKKWRTPMWDWWAEETISQSDFYEAMSTQGDTDIMLTHDRPARAPLNLFSDVWPDDVIVEADAHRALLDEIYGHIKPKMLFHGHYHMHDVASTEFGIVWGLTCDGMDGNMVPVEIDDTKFIVNETVYFQ